MNKVYLMDCMEGMRNTPDKWYDLCVCDPEYGIDAGNMTMGSGKNKKYTKKDWDKNIPTEEYFTELFRVSKNQIVCGGNYFTKFLPPTKSWIFWDKGINGDCSFADGELIWTSFDTVLRKADVRYKGFLGADADRIHITQKPIKLYDWIFSKYATKGMKILDTHAGSMSSVISALKNDMQITAYEIDADYFNAGKKRIETYLQQGNIFQQPQIEFIS